MSNSSRKFRPCPQTMRALAAALEANGICDQNVIVCRRQAQSPATPEVAATRLLILLRNFGRVDALLGTCAAALPAECAVGEPDVRGTLEVAQRMLGEAVTELEALRN